MTSEQILLANRTAKRYGTNRATKIKLRDDILKARVIHFDGYHAESRTGIRASMAVLKKWWNTYHYVPTVCVVEIPDREAIYNNDSH